MTLDLLPDQPQTDAPLAMVPQPGAPAAPAIAEATGPGRRLLCTLITVDKVTVQVIESADGALSLVLGAGRAALVLDRWQSMAFRAAMQGAE